MNMELNTKIWQDGMIKPEIRAALLKLAARILKDSDINISSVIDIIFTGSLAGYNYTNRSDLDLHIILDFDKLNISDEFVNDFLQNIKKIWNDSHDVKVIGYEVEIYFQDVSSDLIASSIFSLIKNQWLKRPKKNIKSEQYSRSKYDKIRSIIDNIQYLEPTSENILSVERLQDRIKRYRLAGLERFGEYSCENLTYKKLRNDGYIDKLYDLGDKLYDQYYSVTER